MSDRTQELEYAVRCWKRLALVLAGALAVALLAGVTFFALYIHQQRVAEGLQRQAEDNYRLATEAVGQMLSDFEKVQPDRRP